MSDIFETIGGKLPRRILPAVFAVIVAGSMIYGTFYRDMQKGMDLATNTITTYITGPKVEDVIDKQPLIERYLTRPLVIRTFSELNY